MSKHFDPISFESFCDYFPQFLNIEFPQVDLIHLWVVGARFGIGRLHLEKKDEIWQIWMKELMLPFSELKVLHWANLTFTQHGNLPEVITPADEFHKIVIDGEKFQWQKDKDLYEFFNKKYKKDFENWVYNASLRPAINHFSKGNNLYLNVAKLRKKGKKGDLDESFEEIPSKFIYF
ncbi:MAG: hypothetical protein K9W44_16240 [Candidatus Lokiarchaeota archaeon]|nr:hypothetical protein [Candidatus Harpocratesius repetitus]